MQPVKPAEPSSLRKLSASRESSPYITKITAALQLFCSSKSGALPFWDTAMSTNRASSLSLSSALFPGEQQLLGFPLKPSPCTEHLHYKFAKLDLILLEIARS